VTAKSGDSLDRIAKKNGTTVKELKRLNGLSGNNPIIQPGQKIRVKVTHDNELILINISGQDKPRRDSRPDLNTRPLQRDGA